jgi:hypothetical protein
MSANTAHQTVEDCSPRIRAFRDEMLRLLPRVPNTSETLALAQAMHIRKLMLAFVTWRMRLIPARPRTIQIWGAISPAELAKARADLEPFVEKVRTGKDINGHLADLVRKSGLIFPGARETCSGGRTRSHHSSRRAIVLNSPFFPNFFGGASRVALSYKRL